jgi:hypothetical protein
VVSVVVPLMLAVLPYMREVAGSTPGLDFYVLCEPIMFLFHCLFHCTLYKQLVRI